MSETYSREFPLFRNVGVDDSVAEVGKFAVVVVVAFVVATQRSGLVVVVIVTFDSDKWNIGFVVVELDNWLVLVDKSVENFASFVVVVVDLSSFADDLLVVLVLGHVVDDFGRYRQAIFSRSHCLGVSCIVC